MTESGFLHRTRASYDALAEDYAEWIRTELAAKPLDRAVLSGFAELVREADAGPVADIGCGPGRLTAHLDGLGVPVFGIDLSPRMIAVARRLYPALRFAEGSMIALDLEDGSLGGLLAWYSIIHVPRERLPEVLAEFHRVLAPGGYLQLGFQVGDEPLHRSEAAGHEISLDFHRCRPDQITELLNQAGLVPYARMVREPDADGNFPETTPQAFLLARKPQS
ncbi:class I SAM-dependent methyltransferase [Amycolatopsis cihanbeyliensis]|uniref:Methyltransferase family protein n=1 Tax=Amycolatopsis cihanbeyliensis TaxID=1128664 RepID=A0A542CTE6_AMYCI|nr:class I SAM-dependent methyltransferase [Amycolatopsis cihanbeyliensis]TQI94106.1 methyltransferase family protein [Amycolatopsis cihanbeyliensis]